MMRNPTDRPNVILINCDDLGYGDLGCYGSTLNRTPVLDGLAGGGVRFGSFYMASSLCSPSRGAMLTGCYPSRIGFGLFDGRGVLFPGQGLGLAPSERTLARVLSDAGYATAMIGKWHCGDQKEFLPTRHGFGSYYGLPFSNDMGRQKGCEFQYPPLPLLRDEEVIQQQPDQRNLIERYTEEAVRFVRASRGGPFFLYLAHMQVHLPLYAPERFLQGSQNGRYGACVEAVDWSTGVILHELRRMGLAESTLVIFTSDNGSRGDNGGSNAPLRGRKGTTWEGGLRVPCLMNWPGVIAPGGRCDRLASSIDLLPTLAKLAGAKVPDDRAIDGVDLRALLHDPAAASPRTTFVYHHLNRLEAVRDGRWKLYVRHGKEEANELYDLALDTAESTNVLAQNPGVVRDLMAKIDAAREDLGDAESGIAGRVRPIGRVAAGVPLTQYDPNHPYIEAEYDLSERG
jgi:arylsulfatase A-like enzyme